MTYDWRFLVSKGGLLVLKLAARASVCVLILITGCARPGLHRNKQTSAAEAAPEKLALDAVQDEKFKCASGKNVTAEFRELFHAPTEKLTEERLARLRQHKVLLVHGLLGEVGLGVRGVLDKFDADQSVLSYLKDQEKVLDQYGIPYERIIFRPHAVDRSGRKIADAILKQDSPVIVFSHSKGCVDTLDALLKLHAENKVDRVAGWISVQGPFLGSPQAERYVRHGGLRTFGIVAMRVMGGDFDAIRDLTPAARERYMAEQRESIREIARHVPVLCFTSWDNRKDSLETPDAPMAAEPEQLTSAFRIQPESCVLPGCDFIAKSGVTHNDPVIQGPQPYDRVAFTKAIFAMLADRMGRASKPPNR